MPKTDVVDTRDTGYYCKECGKRIKYKDLDCIYELRGDLYRLWFCSFCGALTKEDNITDLAIQFELRRLSD